jgi:protein O-GlcNAc transferase
MKQNINSYDECLKKARAFFESGKHNEAMICYRQALNIDPSRSDAYYQIGQLLQFSGHPDDAIAYYLKTLEFNPESAQAYAYMGLIFRGKGEIYRAIEYYTTAIKLNPDYADVYYWLGNAFNLLGQLDEAVLAYDKAAEYKSYSILGRWMSCMCQLPVLYTDQESIHIHRKRYKDQLLRLRETVSLDTPEDIAYAAKAVGSQQPFYLPHQGLNDYELQKIYGELVCRIMSARYPQFSIPPHMPSCMPGERMRVGIVSGYFYYHSNWKLRKGWVNNIDRKRFSLHGYYTGTKKDDWTEAARQLFHVFREGVNSFEELCGIIRSDNLHVLIYPEIGMDPVTLSLASLRLAPVQCTSWGHPDTSGFPTIDYFLSSDLMEPPDADDHYTEKLIRLPNLSIYYTPLDISPADINRKTLNLREKSILYLCSHQLPTHLPQYDEIYPRIAQQVDDCLFLFIEHKSRYVTEQFRQRINHSFNKYGLKADDYIVLFPQLNADQYNAMNILSDIYLDTIGWSACNSAFEAIACNLPIVTLPGNFMRGKHSEAILKMMGLTDTIAGNKDEYIDIAVRLGKTPDLRQSIAGKIAKNKYRIYGDIAAIRGLEEFLIKAVLGE